MNDEIISLRWNSNRAVKYFSEMLAYKIDPISLYEYKKGNSLQIIDVRSYSDYCIGHIPNAISIPEADLDKNLDKISKNIISVIYAYDNFARSAIFACLILAEYGYPVVFLDGGFKVWSEEFSFDIEK